MQPTILLIGSVGKHTDSPTEITIHIKYIYIEPIYTNRRRAATVILSAAVPRSRGCLAGLSFDDSAVHISPKQTWHSVVTVNTVLHELRNSMPTSMEDITDTETFPHAFEVGPTRDDIIYYILYHLELWFRSTYAVVNYSRDARFITKTVI